VLVGIPREVKNHEYRVATTPAGVVELVRRGHRVLVETGVGSSISDAEFAAAGVNATGYETVRLPAPVGNDLVATARPGSVLVDIAIDQGGCFADSRSTHDDPTFHCVATMPGAVPHTSTRALTDVPLPHASSLADKGFRRAVLDDPAPAKGANAVRGMTVLPEVAQAHGSSADL
jgi:alanine dehydrogenase